MNEFSSSPHQPSANPAGAAVGASALQPPARNLGGRPKRVHVHEKPKRSSFAPAIRQMRKETGRGRELVAKLERDYPGDIRNQLHEFFRAFRIPAATGRSRMVSHKTELRYENSLSAAFSTLRELNMPIRNLSELSPRHVRHVTREWERQGHSASSLATLNTALRRLGIWMGKPDLVPLLPELLQNPLAGRRSTSATAPKTWESHGVNPEDVFQAMKVECEITAMQLRLGWAFGLRVEEQLMFRPLESHKGDTLYISRGTKGGKLREVKLLEDWEFALIEQAKAMASADSQRNPLGILSPSVRRLRKALRHFYWLCEKIGLTKKGRFGVTPHGARHSFACRRYQWQSGLPAPVLGGVMPDRPLDTATRLAVSQELGHGRKSASTAYLGTVIGMRSVTRAQLERLKEREHVLGGDEHLVSLARQARLTAFYLVGPAATGDQLPDIVTIFCEANEPIADAHLESISQRCGELLSKRCMPTTRHAIEIGRAETFEILALSRAANPGGARAA